MSDPKMKRGDQKSGMPLVASWVRQYVIVLEFLGMLALLGYIGHRLDQRYDWTPWGLFGGLLLALVGGVYRMIREGQRLDR